MKHTPHDNAQLARRFMRLGLLLPVMLPIILWILEKTNLLDKHPELTDIAFILMFSLVFGGIPYVIFYVISWKVLRDRTERSTLIYVWLSPLLFLVIAAMFLLLEFMTFAVINGHYQSLVSEISAALMISLFVLPIGYGYVVIVQLAYQVFKYIRTRMSPSHTLQERSS